MKDNLTPLYDNQADHDEILDLIASVPFYSSKSQFSDNTWRMDKLKQPGKSIPTLYLSSIPKKYIYPVKLYTIARLNNRIAISGLRSHMSGLAYFFTFIKDICGEPDLKNVNKDMIYAYELFLSENNDLKKATKELYWTSINTFFTTLQNLDEMSKDNLVGHSNPFSRTTEDRLIEAKYVPIDVISQFDQVFMNEPIPLYIKLAYWICRLFPSRIGEVVSMPVDCLVNLGEYYTVRLNMFKQNGQYIEPEIRLVGFKNEGMGAYLIDLIERQIKVATKLQSKVPEDDKNLLFLYQPEVYNIENKRYGVKKNILAYKTNRFHLSIQAIAKRYGVKDADGETYLITSHQLRHNAITDRLYEGFTLLDVKDITHHKTTAMISQSYFHPDKEKTAEKARKASKEVVNTNIFKGKIINNDKALEHILRYPRSHSLGRLGVCSDISACESDMFACLDCDHFIPNVNELAYFEEQVIQWEAKTETFKNHPFMLENSKYNSDLNKKMIDIIREMKKDNITFEIIEDENQEVKLYVKPT